MTLLDRACQARCDGKMLVLKLRRQPTDAEMKIAAIVVVNGKVVKNQVGRMGPWSEVQKDLGGTPVEVVTL
jgi:hypothetical protein